MKRIALLVFVVLLVTACGDDGLLDGLGDRSVNAVHGETSLTSTTVEVIRAEAPLGSIRASDLVWYNDGLEGEGFGVPNVVISTVWNRGDGATSVIQATRNEIAAALPGIQFPELVPDSVGWVTSQMVYDAASGTLGADTSAQFGLWHLEPYSADGGRTAAMWVRPATSSDLIGSISSEATVNGLSLSWVAESFHYRILCPVDLLDENCWQMAESPMPLSLLLPEPEPTDS
ncbi:MAG: hypothetical protein GY926_09810 [bacterium]|nr:hypothetical protein [bacterium]